MKILVTGGSGLIGRHVVDHLVRRGDDVLTIEHAPAAPAPGLAEATCVVAGDAADGALLRTIMADGVEAVVHLAAIPAPVGRTAVELLAANSMVTMAVLEAAGESGVRHVVIASSISILGMAWSAELMHPLHLPIDEDHPLRPTEGYALSKEDDEAAARMAAARWGMTVVALRFPFTTTRDGILERAALARTDPEHALAVAKELWAYLDVRDAAVAVEQSIEAARTGAVAGAVVLNVMTDDVLLDEPLEALLERWHPGVPRRSVLGGGAYSADRARAAIGFDPEHLIPHGGAAE
jgi:nucleoside-diphosphate-sugar epimerase